MKKIDVFYNLFGGKNKVNKIDIIKNNVAQMASYLVV